jgi:hypothetical protein
MKCLRFALMLALMGVSARADILRLRDGRMFTGNFLGATRTEIWFQRDTPGQFLGTAAFPVEEVESLTFGPALKQSSAGASLSPSFTHRALLSSLVTSEAANDRRGAPRIAPSLPRPFDSLP